jgi:hypothetical protein
VVIANGPLVPVTEPELFRWKLGEVMFRRFQTTVPMWIYWAPFNDGSFCC